MAITEHTITRLIGLSVAMLGQAPGTDRLNEWSRLVDDHAGDGMDPDESVDALANHIAETEAFEAKYPFFLSSERFAKEFLGDLLGDNVSAEVMAGAEGIVAGLLNDGMTRGTLALFLVNALLDIAAEIAAGEEPTDLHEAFGTAATAFHNKVMVAEHYTVEARMEDPSASVLDGVTADADSVTMANDAIDNPPTAPEEMMGENYSLARTRDNIKGTDYDDHFRADADEDGFATLNGFDTIDGGGGNDIMSVYDISTDPDIGEAEYDAQVSNIEHLEIFARGGITANLSGWEGLERVELEQFARAGNVSVTVDGATVGTDRTFGGNVTIVGSAGEVSVMAGKTSDIKVGSGAHTTSVMVKGGMTVDVNANGAGGQSMTVTSVSLDGVAGEGLGGDGKRGNPMEGVGVAIAAGNAGLTASATVTQYGTHDGNTFTAVSDTDAAANMYYIAANQPEGLDPGEVVVTTEMDDAKMREQVFVGGKRVDPDTEGAVSGKDSGGVPVHVNSDAIESVALHNTYATVAVVNASKEPEDLMVTVNKYGSATVAGKLCLTGDGAAENVSIMVAGDSNFALANKKTKTVSISGDGDLTLEVTNFVGPPRNVDLESITMSGSGKVTTDVAGMGKLKSIDASASSGANSIKGIGKSVTAVDGGSGGDSVTVAEFAAGGLTVDLGDGDDTFSSAGGHTKSRVDGGEGMDVLHLTGTSATYKADGEDVSIFSNFEALEVGGSGAATHDIALLGVHAVSVSGSTGEGAAVTFENMADGMGISVDGKAGMATIGTDATVIHDMEARKPGAARYSGELDVSLTANGSKTDTATMGTGAAKLTLTADEEIEILNVASSANPAGKAAAAIYRNELVLMGADTTGDSPTAVESSVEAIVVSGSARAMISVATSNTGTVTQFAELELIDAENNSGGVTFSADLDGGTTILAQDLEMSGGSGEDMFTGGAGADKLMGGGGIDTLSGGTGNDTITGGAGGDILNGGDDTNMFKYGSASESQIVFGDKGPSGFDTINGWKDGTNTISLGKAMYGGLHRVASDVNALRELTDDNAINSTDDDTDGSPTANSLKAFLGDGDGVFETVTGTGLQAVTTQHPITTVVETYWSTAPVVDDPDTDADETAAGVPDTRTWVLIDVDADGDFDASVDMVIALAGTVDLADDGTSFTG